MSTDDTSKVNLATFMRDKRDEAAKGPGPFVTLSRQFGCSGYLLGLLLVDLLNNEPSQQELWRVYQREVFERLAKETEIAPETLDRLRREKARPVMEFFRNLTTKRLPGGYEIRTRIANIIRELAFQGRAIIIGLGGAGATADLANGLRVRLEAPTEWRVKRVCEYEGISPIEACQMIRRREKEREHLRRIYAIRFPRAPAFDLVYDCSTFSLAQIAQHIVTAMKIKKMI